MYEDDDEDEDHANAIEALQELRTVSQDFEVRIMFKFYFSELFFKWFQRFNMALYDLELLTAMVFKSI